MPEIEAKFRIDAGAARALRQIEQLGDLQAGPLEEIEQQDTYWDAPSGELARSGIGLRVRRRGAETMFTLKWGEQQEGLFRRQEIEEDAGDRDLHGWLYWLVDSGRADIPAAPDLLQPILTVSTRRGMIPLYGEQGAHLELCIDDVCFEREGRVASEHELELELISGDETDLHRAVEALHRLAPLQPATENKLQRGLRLTGVE